MEWSENEIKILKDSNLSNRDVADQTNRSYSAVKTQDNKCIVQIMAVAEKGGFRLYVSWEWEVEAKKGIFGFVKSDNLYQTFNWEDVNHVANQGWDISGTGEDKRIFSNLFKL